MCLQFFEDRLVVQHRNHAAQGGFEILEVDDVAADTSIEFVAGGLRIDSGLHDT